LNIFVLDEDPAAAAIMLCDKHIPKMIVESAQMLSTAHRMLDGTLTKKRSRSGKTMVKYYKYDDVRESLYYAAVHHHHPCTIWTMESKANYNWHFHHFAAMAKEYHYRRGKQHATWEKLGMILAAPPENIPDVPRTEFAQAMKAYPDCLVPGDAVQAYRNYYHYAKPFAKWEWGREAPSWWKGYQG
tara:strand:+ start:220 stop:777 length:558 start_codon:yes stop_codon:yes gene_type:complete